LSTLRPLLPPVASGAVAVAAVAVAAAGSVGPVDSTSPSRLTVFR